MVYNIIQLRSSHKRLDSSQRFSVKDFTRKKLVGTEILADLPQDLTLQVLLSYAELSVKDALRRMSVIAASMHRDAIIALGAVIRGGTPHFDPRQRNRCYGRRS